MFRELKDLQFPPRYSNYLNFGYGYPLFNFAYPFPFYLSVIIKFLGFGFIDSVKILFAASSIFSVFFTFLASRNIWKSNISGFVASILYLYFPYRLLDLYVRGSIGEALSFVILPLIIYIFSLILDDCRKLRYVIFGALAYSSLILTHNITAVLGTISLLIVFLSLASRKREVIKPIISIFILGPLLSAYFWMPALYEKKYIILSKISIARTEENFLTLGDILFSTRGNEISGYDRLTFQLGWPLALTFLISSVLVLFIIIRKKEKIKDLLFPIILVLGTLIYSFMLFKPSIYIWHLPILTEITFPWIVLGQLGLLIAIISGFLVKYKITFFMSLALAILAILIYFPQARVDKYDPRDEDNYLTNEHTTTTSREYMPLWVKDIPEKRHESKVEILDGSGRIDNLFVNSKKIEFDALVAEDSILRINTIYYPGWKVYVNGQETSFSYQNNRGVMEIKVEEGSNSVMAKFTETPLRLLGNLISFSTFLLLLVLALFGFRKKYAILKK
jgi:hypothetical protein